MMTSSKVNCIDILCHPTEDYYFQALSILKPFIANSSNQGKDDEYCSGMVAYTFDVHLMAYAFSNEIFHGFQ